jgi:hypothetical protein
MMSGSMFRSSSWACPSPRVESGVVLRRVLEFVGGASGAVRVSDQAARSIAVTAIGWPRLCKPSTLRIVIWLEASSAQNSIAAVSAEGITVQMSGLREKIIVALTRCPGLSERELVV